MQEIEKHRPRVVIGEGQGGVVVGMSSFHIILERACRDRAVTQLQMATYRQAWSGVAALFIVDPVILPSSNNTQSVSIGMLRSAFPAMEWNQPRTNRRAMLVTSKYMTINFAVEFGGYIGCNAEKGMMPGEEFFEEAKAPPPLYFETDERSFKVCAASATRKEFWVDDLTLIADFSCTTLVLCLLRQVRISSVPSVRQRVNCRPTPQRKESFLSGIKWNWAR